MVRIVDPSRCVRHVAPRIPRSNAGDHSPANRVPTSGDATSRSSRARRLLIVNPKRPFESIVAAHGAAVLRVCRAVLGSADTEDAWSETFLSAFKAYPDLPADANVEAWLVTIAHRKAIDFGRAKTRRAVPVHELPESVAAVIADADIDLADAVSRLPDKQKQVIAYHYLAGLPYAEIATIVGGSTDAARRSGADGIANLRRAYPHLSAPKGRTS